MDIKELQKSWDSFGQKDPFWAILTSSSRRNNKWNQKEFFATGETQIALVMKQLDTMGLHLKRGRCLDFGCGVGRLTQALCQFFEECDGVDIAPSMVKAARHYNSYAERCRYHLNEMSDLRLFGPIYAYLQIIALISFTPHSYYSICSPNIAKAISENL
jgi:2-polyprenyl-3-methyl-5-hydroxy-6-metoxy-1,4-benzoquinol methylase